MLNDFGYKVIETRTDNFTAAPLDNYYAYLRQAERLLSRRKLTRGELAKYLGTYPRKATRIIHALELAIPLTVDDNHRWYVLGTDADKC